MAKKKVPTKEILEKHTPEELVPEKTVVLEKEYWLSLAREHIKEFTGKKTPLSALYYFAHQLNGDVLFVQMVAEAMKRIHDELTTLAQNPEKLKEMEDSLEKMKRLMEAEALDEEIKFDEIESE